MVNAQLDYLFFRTSANDNTKLLNSNSTKLSNEYACQQKTLKLGLTTSSEDYI